MLPKCTQNAIDIMYTFYTTRYVWMHVQQCILLLSHTHMDIMSLMHKIHSLRALNMTQMSFSWNCNTEESRRARIVSAHGNTRNGKCNSSTISVIAVKFAYNHHRFSSLSYRLKQKPHFVVHFVQCFCFGRVKQILRQNLRNKNEFCVKTTLFPARLKFERPIKLI